MSIKHIKNGHEHCVIVFSAYQIDSKKQFTFYKNMEDYFDKYDFLFLLDDTNRWYNYSFSDINLDNVNEITSYLNKILEGYLNISLMGSSMGGYASLLYSNLNNVSNVTVISPQIFLKENWPRYKQSNLNGQEILDLRVLKENNLLNINKINYFIGLNDLYDLYQALYFFGNAKNLLKNVTLIPNSFHNIALHFHKKNILNRFFHLILNEKIQLGMSPYGEIYSYDQEIYNLIISEDFKTNLEYYYNSFFSGDTKEALKVSKLLIEKAPNWLGLKRIYGLALFAENKYEEAANILLDVSKSFDIDDIYYELCLSLFYTKKYNEMLESLNKAKSLNKGVYSRVQKKLLELLDSLIKTQKDISKKLTEI